MNDLCLASDVRLQPSVRHTGESVWSGKTLEKGSVSHSIKRRTDIEEGKEGDLILIDGRVEVGEDSEYGCLCGMISAETRLEFREQTISRLVRSEPSQDQLLNDLWHEWKVRNWPVVFYFTRIQPWFLEVWHNYGSLLR